MFGIISGIFDGYVSIYTEINLTTHYNQLNFAISRNRLDFSAQASIPKEIVMPFCVFPDFSNEMFRVNVKFFVFWIALMTNYQNFKNVNKYISIISHENRTGKYLN